MAGAIWPAPAGDLRPAQPTRPDGNPAKRPGTAPGVVVDQPLWMDRGRNHLPRPDHLRRPRDPHQRPGRPSATTGEPRMGRAAPQRRRNKRTRVASDRQRSRRLSASRLNGCPAARVDPYRVKSSPPTQHRVFAAHSWPPLRRGSSRPESAANSTASTSRPVVSAVDQVRNARLPGANRAQAGSEPGSLSTRNPGEACARVTAAGASPVR